MFDDDWPRVHLGIVVGCYLAAWTTTTTAQFIWIIGAKMASPALLFVSTTARAHEEKREEKKKPTTAATWLDHYFQVRGNIAVNSEVSSWLLLWSSGNACTAMLHASYVGVTLRRILVSYASGRKLKSSGHHFISKTSSRKTQHHNFQAQKYQ